MTYFIKIRYIMGFQNMFMAEMDRVGVQQSPFPTHDLKFSVEIDGIHYIGTEIKWRKVLCGGRSLLMILGDGSG